MRYSLWSTLMKLNDFFTKSPKAKASSRKIVTVVNDRREQELRGEIQELTKSLSRLEIVEKENVTLNDRAQNAETHLKEILEREQDLHNTNARLQISITEGDGIRTDNQTLKNELRELTNQLDRKNDTLNEAHKTNAEVTRRTDKLTKQLQELTADDDHTKRQLENSLHQTSVSLDQLNKMQDKVVNIDKVFQATEVKYTEAQKINNELMTKVTYWSSVANTLQEERDDLEHTYKMVTELSKTLETDNRETKGAVRITQNELTKLRGTLAAMTRNMDDLVQENKYLSGVTAQLKTEMARPKYMSIAAINRSEGFKLPTGGYRKHFLGNSKPTLLKFKREEKHDN